MAVRTFKGSGATHAVRRALLAASACAGVVGTVNGAFAQTSTTHTWIGGASGEQSWDVPTNWSTDTTPPSNTVPDALIATEVPEIAVINDTITGSRNITTPSNRAITVELDWTNPASATGINTITLGNHFFFGQTDNSGTNGSTLINGRSADTMVLDLNGFDVASAYTTSGPNAPSRLNMNFLLGTPITVVNSGSTVATIFGGRSTTSASGAILGSGVHLSQALSGNNTLTGVTFQDGSILSIVDGPSRTTTFPTAGVWDLNFTTTGVLASHVLVRNDLAISGAGSINFATSSTRLVRIGDDFADTPDAAASDYVYTTGHTHQIIFNGGLTDGGGNDKVQTVNLGRSGVSKVQFFVGDPAAGGTKGHAQLAANFTTVGTSSLRVVDGSILDIGGFDLTTPTVTFDDNTTLLLAFNDLAAESGSISATNLTLAGILDIDLDLTGTWTGMKDLVLMSYSGLFTGSSANVNLIDLPGGFTYDEIRTDNGTLRLTNAALPEPGAAVAAFGAMSLLLSRRRRAM